jgi:hypothetical protein
MSNVALKGGDLLTQNPTIYDCCEELDVKFKQTASHFEEIKYTSINLSDVEGKLQNKNGQTTRQSNTVHIL